MSITTKSAPVRWTAAVDRLAKIRPERHSSIDVLIARALTVFAVIAMSSGAGYGIFVWWQDILSFEFALALFTGGMLQIGTLVLLRRFDQPRIAGVWSMTATTLMNHMLLIKVGGTLTALILWIPLYPVLAVFFAGRRFGYGVFVYLSVVVLNEFRESGFTLTEPNLSLTAEQLGTVACASFIPMVGFLVVFVSYLATGLRSLHDTLAEDRGRMVAEVVKRKETEIQLQSALDQKDIMIQEIHHRVKNNMGIVSSILSLQERTLDDDKTSTVLRDTISRIRAMAAIHERLYHTESMRTIAFTDFVRDVIQQYSSKGIEGEIDLNFEIDVTDDEFQLDLLVPIGLIVNEIITNALKYAFCDQQAGTISIKLTRSDTGVFDLVIADDGCGFNMAARMKNSFGMKMIQGLASQIRAELLVESNEGTSFYLSFAES